MVKSSRQQHRVTPLNITSPTDRQRMLSSGTEDSVHIAIADPLHRTHSLPRRLRNAKRKITCARTFNNPLHEQDGVADPLFELGPAPKNKHLALLYYFFKLAENPNTIANFEYIAALLSAGADVNAQDRIGQTVLHEVARDWGHDVAEYLIDKGADVELGDEQGRCPLHIACRTENEKVVRCLLDRGADINKNTAGELQTPLHYAARHDAADVIEVLHEYGVPLNPRDYKGRTPLLLAAELDRSVAASKLLEFGAKAGIIDKTGLHTLCAMVEKMPGVAYRALDQFHITNRASRQQYFFLNYLEPDPDIDEASFLPMSVLGSVVRNEELKLIVHPVIKEMIEVKWSRFGRLQALFWLFLYVVYLVAWTMVVVSYPPWKLPNANSEYSEEQQHNFTILNKVSVYIAVALFLVQLIDELMEIIRNSRVHSKFKTWRSKQIERDLQYVPSKMTEEREYLEDQIESIKTSSSGYLSDMWNWFDWMTYLAMFVTTCCVLTCLHGGSGLYDKYPADYTTFALWTSRLMCTTLVLIWFKLFKYVRVFSFLGPFVVIMAETITDVFKITFVFAVFYIPTVAVFYHFYKDSESNYFGDIRGTMFTVYRMLLVDDYGYDDIRTYSSNNTKLDRVVRPETGWTDLVVSCWLMFGAIIILNLLIALMSDTFQRLFDNATEIALLQRANSIVSSEEKLPEQRKLTFLRFIKEKCAPREGYYDDDRDDDDDGFEVKKYAQQTFELVKNVQVEMAEWKEEQAASFRTELSRQLHVQAQDMRRVEQVVQHLRRVMEANSKFQPKSAKSTRT